MCYSATAIVNAVIEFHRFIPIVFCRVRRKAVVTRCPSGIFYIAHAVELRTERFSYAIVEVVMNIEMPAGAVFCTEVFNPFGCGYGVVITCYVVRHEIDDYLQSRVEKARRIRIHSAGGRGTCGANAAAFGRRRRPDIVDSASCQLKRRRFASVKRLADALMRSVAGRIYRS